MPTGTEALAAIRAHLNEPVEAAWLQTTLRTYLNEACRDIARRTLCLRDDDTIVGVAGTTEYVAPARILRIYRAEWRPGGADTRKIPLTAKAYGAMDAIWYSDQDTFQSEPIFYMTWGTSPALKFKVYPAPYQASTFELFVARLPVDIAVGGANDALALDLPTGWEEVAYSYVLYKAFTQHREFDISNEHLKRYEERIDDMITVIGDYTDTPQEIYGEAGRGWNNDPYWFAR